MLGNIIFIIFFILLTINICRNINSGIISYIIFSIISPNLIIGNLQISFEILAFFLVLILIIIIRPYFISIEPKFLYKSFILYLFIYIISSLLATLRYGSLIPWISFFGIFRIIFFIYILQFIIRDNPFEMLDKILSPLLIINLITSIIQLTIPTSIKIFYDFYYKNSLTPLDLVLKLGHFDRAYGTFGSPILLGVLSVFSFAVYIGFLSEKKKSKLIYIKLILSIIIGLVSLTKTAILGIAIITILYYILNIFGLIKARNKNIIIIPLLVIPITFILIKLLEQHGTAILWYMQFLSKPLESLETRYNSINGLLASSYYTISKNWFLGVGGTPIGNDFLGDSMYIGILYSTGLIGLIIYFSTIINITLINLKKRHITALLCFLAICLAGFAMPIQFNIMIVPLISFMISNNRDRINKMIIEIK